LKAAEEEAMRLALVSVSVLALSRVAAAQAPAGQKPVEVDFEKTADFSSYHTYAWAPFQEPASNPANHIRITRAVERELEAKGFTKGESAAATDIFVHYQGSRDKKVRGTPSQRDSNWQPSNPTFQVDFSRVEVGTLVVELWDAKTKDIVWRAKAAEVIRREDQAEEVINQAVKRLMAAYPPKPQ
jgi:hypothetical protein